MMVVVSLVSFNAQTSFATSLSDASIKAPWNVVKVGDRVKGMKVSYVQAKGGLGVTLEGKKHLSGTVECADEVNPFQYCVMTFNKTSQKLLPWGVGAATLNCGPEGDWDGKNYYCQQDFLPGKKYRARIEINSFSYVSCDTDCDFGGIYATIARIDSKALLGKKTMKGL